MRLREDAPRLARVEMTPIMDVVFLLLVFFIYAFLSMTVQRGVRVNLPRAEGTVSHARDIQIVLTSSDEILLDGRTAMSLDAAVAAAALRHRTLGVPVVIRADRAAHVGPALGLMAALRAEGVAQVTYQVERPSETSRGSLAL